MCAFAARVLLQDGASPVFIAALTGDTAALEMLIRAGADVNAARKVRRVGRGSGRWKETML